jgi:hypothetical protein
MDLRHSLYGYGGMEDLTLFPRYSTGLFVQIYAHQKRIEWTTWSTELDRPTYFVELRDEYAC